MQERLDLSPEAGGKPAKTFFMHDAMFQVTIFITLIGANGQDWA
jgi:hypothetical protein